MWPRNKTYGDPGID